MKCSSLSLFNNTFLFSTWEVQRTTGRGGGGEETTIPEGGGTKQAIAQM